MMLVTLRMPRFLDPVVLGTGRPLSFKQTAEGTVLIGGGRLARVERNQETTELDFRELAASARTVHDLFPVMRGAVIHRGWAGIEARMPDEIPVIGPSSTAPNVFSRIRLFRPRIRAGSNRRPDHRRSDRSRQDGAADLGVFDSAIPGFAQTQSVDVTSLQQRFASWHGRSRRTIRARTCHFQLLVRDADALGRNRPTSRPSDYLWKEGRV